MPRKPHSDEVISKPKGTAFNASMYHLRDIKETGRTVALVLVNGSPYDTEILTPDNYKTSLRTMYDLSIATDNPQVLMQGISDYYGSKGFVYPDNYSMKCNPSMMKDIKKNIEYPETVRIRIPFGMPFHYQDVVGSLGIKTYMSSLYNNGLFPTSNAWFIIPPSHREARALILEKYKKNPGLSMSDLNPLRSYDLSLYQLLRSRGEAPELQYRIGFHEHHVANDTLNPQFSIRLYGTQLLDKENPIIPRMDVEVLDCVPLSDAQNYISKHLRLSRNQFHSCEYDVYPQRSLARIARHTSPYAFYKTPLNEFFMFHKMGSESNLGVPSQSDTNIANSMLIQVLSLTTAELEMNEGLN